MTSILLILSIFHLIKLIPPNTKFDKFSDFSKIVGRHIGFAIPNFANLTPDSCSATQK